MRLGAFVPPSDRELEAQAQLLANAETVGLQAHPAVLRLRFMHGVLREMKSGGISGEALDRVVREAEPLALADTPIVQHVRRYHRLWLLERDGPAPIGEGADSTALYFRGPTEYRNKPGTLEVTERGLTFLGEVRLELLWERVQHVASTTHTYRGFEQPAIAIQEAKRRTATKFVFGDDFGPAVVEAVWELTQDAAVDRRVAADDEEPQPF